MKVADCIKAIEALEEDFEIQHRLSGGWGVWCRYCNVGWEVPRKFTIGNHLAILNHLYGHKNRKETCKCPPSYHKMFIECRGY